MSRFRLMPLWLKALVIVLAVVIPTTASFTARTRWKTFTREPLVSTDLNGWQDAVDASINIIGAYVPGGATGDTIKIPTAAIDTLSSKAIAKIVVKDPLVSLSAADSLKFHAGNFQRLNLDSLNTLGPVVSWPYDFSAGKRVRGNLFSLDSLRIVDSLTVAPGAKTKWIPGAGVVSIPRASIDTLTSGLAASDGSPTGAVSVDATGAVTMANQPSFCAVVTSDLANVTGDNTVYTIAWSSERWDQGANFSSTLFTASVTGKYHFDIQLAIQDVGSGHTSAYVNLVTSNITWQWTRNPAVELLTLGQIAIPVTVDMDANDTASLTVDFRNSTKTVDIHGDATAMRTWWQGYLVH